MMEYVEQTLSQMLGMAVIHSLWQGLLIFLLLKIVLVSAPSLSAAKKHDLALAALFMLTGCFVTTIFIKANGADSLANNQGRPALTPATLITDGTSVNYPTKDYAEIINDYLPYITTAYFIGLLFQLIRLGLAWNTIARIKRSLSAAPAFDELVRQLTERSGIKKHVAVMHSHLVSIPGIIGYTKPLILLPLSFACNLSASETESILLHELAHIRRNDFLVNLAQRIISVILFFNPFVQLINAVIDIERENSCDDLVVQITESPLAYAHGLLKLQQTGNDPVKLALAATGKKYRLLNRIERIMKPETPGANARYLLVVVLLFFSVLANIAFVVPRLKEVASAQKKSGVLKDVDKRTLPPIVPRVEPAKKSLQLAEAANLRRVAEEPFKDVELEKLYEQARVHVGIFVKIFKSPRIGNPEFNDDLAAFEASLTKAGSRYTPEFQKKADSIKTELDNYPLVKKEWLLMNEALNKIATYLSSPAYLQKIQKLSPEKNARYMKYLEKLQNSLKY